ncbi:MAG: hypothetical protein Q9191_008085 [Dirinaria sp. TL-2023a]
MSPSPGLRLPTAASHSFIDSQVDDHSHDEKPPSPIAPPYSPITPVMSTADLASTDEAYSYYPPAEAPKPPPPVPFSESDNPDAMALQSAISILQIQRQQSLQDMKTLQEQKLIATADPEGFARAVAAGELKTTRSGGVIDGLTLDLQEEELANGDSDGTANLDEDDSNAQSHERSKFGAMPGLQKVVRCPPINWAKYHVVGEPLDRMHEEQRKRPTLGEPHVDEEPARAVEHVIAAPYNPWTDKLPETSMRTRSVTKKES